MYAGFFDACAKSVNDLLDWFCKVWVSVCICTLLILGT